MPGGTSSGTPGGVAGAAPGLADADATIRFTHQEVKRVLSGILLCILLAAIDQTVVIPAVPAMARDLHGFSHLAWIVSAYLLTSTAATPIYGRLSDFYGRRKLLLPALAIFAAASVLCALAQTLWQLIAFRAIQGIGGAGLMAMAQAAIADVVSPRERGRYQGYMASTWALASIAGPILGGWMTDAVSWRWIFWVNVPIALAAMLLCDRALRLLRVKNVRARIDYAGAALLIGGVTAWLLVLSWGGVEMPWTAPPIGLMFLGGLVLLGVLAWHERRTAEPLLPPRLFADATFVRGVIIAFFQSLAMFGGTFLLPLYFQLVGGADASSSGMLVVPFLGASCVGAIVAGSIARRSGRPKGLLLVGIAGCVIGFALLATMGVATAMALAVLYQSILGFALGLIGPTSLVLVQNAAERRDVGTATGCLLFLRSLGGAFGSTLVASLLALRFASEMAASGFGRHLDLGAITQGGSGLAGVGGAEKLAAAAALANGFHWAFAACALLLVVAYAVAMGLGDVTLRSADKGAEPAPLAH
ncbi:MAG: MFS transporter [Rhodospirillales bacterium]|nr:MFS transporter [Rhodospirillales bacterium]